MWYVELTSKEHMLLIRIMQATGYQRKYTKRKIMFFLLLCVIGMIILLIVKPKRSRASDDLPSSTGSDPIGNLGVAEPQPAVPEPGPDVVRPNGIEMGG